MVQKNSVDYARKQISMLRYLYSAGFPEILVVIEGQYFEL